MLVSRTLHLGLLVFAVALLVGTIVEKSRSREAAPARATTFEPVTIVDVSRGVDPASIPDLVRLRDGERVLLVGDQPVANDLAAGAAIAERAMGPGKFLDLAVGSPSTSRRVLVLMH